ncbi:helix-turn-helix domain-containing protein [Fluviicola chungangensis]|uniref:Helix-turn-helix transcriptional regulator n=1 Tax=Fluviicola chungangensis TaxID=2597671 RepID=A0A556MY81_9FLAO|nr:AraC family transcriptional regulator [Fluviicola chungangensis]TSJ44874.1 helix-turn-helix transcriptional regulator [Fluviicola chungangensis]
MKATDIKSCYIGPEISPEQFVPEHFFLYIGKGLIHGYDGHRNYTLQSGEYCIVRRNKLARYNKERENGEFEKVVIVFDKIFLRSFFEKHPVTLPEFTSPEAFVLLPKDQLIDHFIQSLMPYYSGFGKIDPQFADLKREELLLILLKQNPQLAAALFNDRDVPDKINLEAFMNRNFKFNVSIERFAFLTGRSISSFKRDFEKTFHNTPGKWLTQKRLEEAHFLLSKKSQKPIDIYLDLGFEDLSHFSYAFKRQFGINPTELVQK